MNRKKWQWQKKGNSREATDFFGLEHDTSVDWLLLLNSFISKCFFLKDFILPNKFMLLCITVNVFVIHEKNGMQCVTTSFDLFHRQKVSVWKSKHIYQDTLSSYQQYFF